ncbi:MAG: RagB/SusD family nutrient uptake outer membrane protein, partial [Flavobacteriaceae bacterium]|nr:RagB/SusD family nutrient uptake outer membrane protein [Flavobacteriaceae bacterium]
QGYRDIARDYLLFNEMTTDILIERGGGINANTQPVEDFEWSSTHPWLSNLWNRYYVAIYRANVTIDKVPGIEMNEDRKAQIIAEARFLRAFNYFRLYNLFGPVPLIQTSETTVTDRPTRATKEEILTFMANEFRAVSEILPATQEQYGRATSGAALGFLSKMYLNNKDWQQAAQTSQELINSGVYDLFTEGRRADLFALENEGDNEFIFVAPFPDNPATGLGNTYLSHAAPPGYQFKFPPKVNFAAQFKIRSEYLELFSEEDERLDAFIFEYENRAGDIIQLGQDDVRSFKYPEDPNGIGDISGNDWPYLRYADILLARAEALNELQGPNQESIDLINQIRSAAGLELINVADFSSADELNEFILAERGRELHTEGLRRQDLIRHGVFIEWALERGHQAADHQVLFPIPQSEVDKNPNLEQNPGY